MATIRVSTFARRAIVPFIEVDGYFATDTWTLNTAGLPNITAYDWKSDGVSTGDTTSATPSLTGREEEQISCLITYNGGSDTIETPAVKVHSLDAEDADHEGHVNMAMAIAPHSDRTHISKQTGNWSDTTTWHGGQVPVEGSAVLVSNGHTVTLDASTSDIRSLRIDGTLSVSTSTSTTLNVETILVSESGTYKVASSGARLPSNVNHVIEFLDRDYRKDRTAATPVDIQNDPMLHGRGYVCLGTTDIWGKERKTWMAAKPVSAGATQIEIVDRLNFGRAALFTGLSTGDTIVIGGTKLNLDEFGVNNNTLHNEDEEVTVSTITVNGDGGHTVTFSPALSNNHVDQYKARKDCYITVMAKESGNITVRSRSNNEDERGHWMMMDINCEIDLWSVDFVNLGRTSKIEWGGLISGGIFYQATNEAGGNVVRNRGSATARANILGRYAGPHCHRTGRRTLVEGIKRREIHDCYVGPSATGDEIGSCYVHHDGHVNFFGCTAFGYWGTGLVAEQGNETGAWVECLQMGAITDKSDARIPQAFDWYRSMKSREDDVGQTGEVGRFGAGRHLRSRNVRDTRNRAQSVACGVAFWQRGSPGTAFPTYLQAPLNPKREDTDWTYLGIIQTNGVPADSINFADSPVRHFEHNDFYAVTKAVEVTKNQTTQKSDHSIIWGDCRVFGSVYAGPNAEYISNYGFIDWDITSDRGKGILLETNTYDSGAYRCQVFTPDTGFEVSGTGDTVPGDTDLHDATNVPRWSNVQFHYDGGGSENDGALHASATYTNFTDVTYIDKDEAHTAVTRGQDPTTTYGRKFCEWDGLNNGNVIFDNQILTNASGAKVDNLSSTGELFPKPFWQTSITGVGDQLAPLTASTCRTWGQEFGYWELGGVHCLAIPMTWQDRITRDVSMYIHTVEAPSGTPTIWTGRDAGSFNGTLAINATQISASPVYATCAIDGTVNIDPTVDSSPSGSSGSFSVTDLHNKVNILRPNNGEITWSGNVFTYTPDPDFAGSDKFAVHIYSEGHYKRIDCHVLVGPAGTQPTPVHGTHFTATGGSGQIVFDLLEKPDCYPRKPKVVFYQTDSDGWRRLCYNFATCSHAVTVRSNGTALSTDSINVQIKYETDYDEVQSSASTAQSVTVI